MTKRNYFIFVYLTITTICLFIILINYVFAYDIESPRMYSDQKDIKIYGAISAFAIILIYFMLQAFEYENKLRGKFFIIYGTIVIIITTIFSLISKSEMSIKLTKEKREYCWIEKFSIESWEVIGDNAKLNSPYASFGLLIIGICIFFVFYGFYLIFVKSSLERKLWKIKFIHILYIPTTIILIILAADGIVFETKHDQIDSFKINKDYHLEQIDRSNNRKRIKRND